MTFAIAIASFVAELAPLAARALTASAEEHEQIQKEYAEASARFEARLDAIGPEYEARNAKFRAAMAALKPVPKP